MVAKRTDVQNSTLSGPLNVDWLLVITERVPLFNLHEYSRRSRCGRDPLVCEECNHNKSRSAAVKTDLDVRLMPKVYVPV